MESGRDKPDYREILTWGQPGATGSGRGGPLGLDTHATFLLPTRAAQEREVAFDAPEASATESLGQCKAPVAARGG